MASHRPAIVSVSLGRAQFHGISDKIAQASKLGFEGIEVFYEDLEAHAKQISGTSGQPTGDELIVAAQQIQQLCKSHNLAILSLQPFSFYEGLMDRNAHRRRIEELVNVWFGLVKVLGVDAIQIPANFLPADQLTGNLDIIVDDLRKVADLGLTQKPVVRFVYENLCWSTHIDTWEKAWDVVQRVDRPNFGICLDTFNIAGRIWADPTSPNGKVPNADEELEASMKRLVETVDVCKVFYIQVVDAERMSPPLTEGHPMCNPEQPARLTWSRNARTFLYEEERGAYLPVEHVAKTLISGLGYTGFVSLELFSRTLAETGADVPEQHALRGITSWRKFVRRLGLNAWADDGADDI